MTAANGRPDLVTIGITCFNAAGTIERAILSALKQDWPHCEILIVDDCSSDTSAAVIERLIASHGHARLIRHTKNKGPAGARNTILAEARGEFVAFFDDDDEALAHRVRSQVEHLTAYETRSGARLIACHASGERHYSTGYRMALKAIGSRGREPPHGPAVAEALLLNRHRPDWFFGAGPGSGSLLARRSTFQAVGGFDPALRRVEDADFAVRMALLGGHFIGTPEPLFVQYATSSPDKSPEKNLEAEQAMVIKHRAYLESIDAYDYALNWPKLRYCHFKRRYGTFSLVFLKIFLRNPLFATRHLLTSGPRRLMHERRITRGAQA